MNLKNIIAALATTITVATTTAAMADVRFSGGAEVTVQGGVTIRDHRTPTTQPVYVKPVFQPAIVQQPVRQPVVVRDHRTPSHRWDTRPVYEPVVYQPTVTEPPYITCNSTYGTNLGTEQMINGETISLSNVRGIDTLQLQWVSGVSIINDIKVNYMNGVSKIYHLGNALTPHASAPGTIDRSKVIDVDNRPIQSITIYGSTSGAASNARFALIAK